MGEFRLPKDLKYNRGLIDDPIAYMQATGAASWLFLVGDEFASMPGGMSYTQVQEASPVSRQIPSDPPRLLDIDLARRHVAALDQMPRPTLISCRTGPRASAAAYIYAGLKAGATPEEVLAAAERESAPFCGSEECKEWVRASLGALRDES